jgi:alcohol dehydrogenase YqhD (iron-dependent ADH family)
VTNEDGWFKRVVNIDVIRPKFAILNPELTYTLSRFQTVCGAFDAMSHAMERYFTATDNVYATDRQCEAVIRSFIYFIPQVIANPKDYDIRAELIWLSKIAHDDSLGVGRQGDYASHRIGHEVSALFDVPHAATLSIMFPAWMKYVYMHNLKRFVQFSVNIWNNDYSMNDEKTIALKGIQQTENFLRSIGMPTTFKDLDVKIDRLEEMAKKCTLNGPTGNMVRLGTDDVLKILTSAC